MKLDSIRFTWVWIYLAKWISFERTDSEVIPEIDRSSHRIKDISREFPGVWNKHVLARANGLDDEAREERREEREKGDLERSRVVPSRVFWKIIFEEQKEVVPCQDPGRRRVYRVNTTTDARLHSINYLLIEVKPREGNRQRERREKRRGS